MKKITTTFLSLFIALTMFAQPKTPVKWSYSYKKINPTTYDLIFTANIDPTWHMYTIDHKADVGLATTITIKKNPLGANVGKLKVAGKPVSMKDPSTGDKVKFYEKSVVFTQQIKLKAPVKTSYSGTVEFMACDDKMCIPPTTKEFTIALQ